MKLLALLSSPKAVAIAAVAAFAAGGAAGWKIGEWRAGAAHRAEMELALDAARRASEALAAQVSADNDANAALTRRLNAERSRRRALEQEVRDATLYVPGGGNPFSADFERLWNASAQGGSADPRASDGGSEPLF